MRHLSQYPLFVLITMIGALAMLIPAAHAARNGDWLIARVFFQYALLIVAISVIVGLAMMNRTARFPARSQLLTLIYAFSVLPLFLGLPLMTLYPSLGVLRAYFEMLSSLTTTGATLFDDPFRVAETIHLWRALVGWMGGFLALMAAFAVLEPLNIGGFEVRNTLSDTPTGAVNPVQVSQDGGARIIRVFKQLAPAYLLFTALLTLLLIFSGDRVFSAVCHAMSVIATSGISPTHGLEGAGAGRLGEVFIALFFLLAISSRFMVISQFGPTLRGLHKDPEFRLMVIAVTIIPVFLFLRHWFAAFEVDQARNFTAGIHALWGSFFTVLSFLTTTGFESADWANAREWSGLHTPGIIFLGLVVMGGGVATTAGGIKLLRIYALYRHTVREMGRLVYPSSIGRSGLTTRRFRRQGAVLAWVFLMLFLIGIAVSTAALAFAGAGFEKALTLAIASLTNTGPILSAMGDPSLTYSGLSDSMLGIISATMVLGRVETLALIALLNPDYWR